MCGHKYTDEERRFLADYVLGHSYAEIQKAFVEKFGWEFTTAKLKSYIGNHKLNTGRNGRFIKGHQPINKGQKMSLETYEKVKKTMFQKGHTPINHRPVGSERVNVDGYVEIKVEEPNKWRLKHNVVYEDHYGAIPKNSVVVFLDGNKLNVEIENLKLITRSELLLMNRKGLFFKSADATEAGTNLAKLIDATCKAKRQQKENI